MKSRCDENIVIKTFVKVGFSISIEIMKPCQLITPVRVDHAINNFEAKSLVKPARKSTPGNLRQISINSRGNPHVTIPSRTCHAFSIGEEIVTSKANIRFPGIILGQRDIIHHITRFRITHPAFDLDCFREERWSTLNETRDTGSLDHRNFHTFRRIHQIEGAFRSLCQGNHQATGVKSLQKHSFASSPKLNRNLAAILERIKDEDFNLTLHLFKLKRPHQSTTKTPGHFKNIGPSGCVAQDRAGLVAIDPKILGLFIRKRPVLGLARILPFSIYCDPGAFVCCEKVILSISGQI